MTRMQTCIRVIAVSLSLRLQSENNQHDSKPQGRVVFAIREVLPGGKRIQHGPWVCCRADCFCFEIEVKD